MAHKNWGRIGELRLRTLSSTALVLLMLVMNCLAVGLGHALLAEESEKSEDLVDPQMQATTSGHDIRPKGLGLDTLSDDPKTGIGNTDALGSGFFRLFDSERNVVFDGVEEWSSFAAADNDSVELVIGLSGEVNSQERVTGLVIENGGKLVNTVSMGDRVVALVVDVPLELAAMFSRQIQASSLARFVEPNMRFRTQFVPDDSYWNLQWGPQKIEADWAWNTTRGDHSVLVAVIDTGVQYTHPDLAENYVVGGLDWVNDDPDPVDDNGHGTHCAGIVAALIDNSVGIAGVANVTVMAEKGLDEYGNGWEDDLANAIIHAVDQGADILSNSWGGYGESMLIHDAVKYAYDSGVLVVAAAGNEAWSNKLYPAAYDEAIAVTATDSNDYPATFTNFGDWVELAAPGVNIYSTILGSSYDYKDGTSMACPHVSGVAALIWSQFPNVSRDWIRAQLRFTSDDLGDPGFDVYYGHGRVNARKAVEQAPPDHDLLVFNWQSPSHIEPGDVVSLSVDVLNFGATDEQNVTVLLLVDGNQTDSANITNLARGTLGTATLSWMPLAEGTYNVTLVVVPVPGETMTDNNVVTEMIMVRYALGFVLFDQTRCDAIGAYSLWVANLTARGYVVDSYSDGVITPEVLAGYDILVIPQAWSDYSFDEVSAIQGFVLDGGGLLVIGDDSPWIYSSLTGFADIFWDYYTGWWGYTSDITPHDITEGVALAYFDSPVSQLLLNFTSISLIRDGYGSGDVMLAASEAGFGKVIGIADEHTVYDYAISRGDNMQLANNMIDWLVGEKQEHELVVRLDAPNYLEPGKTIMLNATVRNRGLNNETNVELTLLINGTIAGNATIPELVNGTAYTISYSWSPATEAIYNVTGYAQPVPGENITLNNIRTKFVSVHYPLISPVEGQYANYALNTYDPFGQLLGSGFMNFTYDYYSEPYKIHITMRYIDPSGYSSVDTMIVNTMNRYVESGSWAGFWYPGWIETNIDVGSTLNLLSGNTTVVGSRMTVVAPRAVECWETLYYEYVYNYTFAYDKNSGLWISMETVDPSSGYINELILIGTNVSVGLQYEHDLGVSLDTPQFLEPGETSLLVGTVHNLGLHNETNVEIHLSINGTEVAGETLSELVNGTWHAVNHSWTPLSEGIYNITAYTHSVPGENITINNLASKLVRVRYIEIALVSDYNELTTVAPILDSIGIGYDVYNDNVLNLYTEDLSLLLRYKAVIFCTGYRWLTTNEHSTLEAYLSSGGNLLITGFDCLVSDLLLADLIRSSSTGDNVGEPDLYVIDDAHPIMNGPYGTYPAGYHIAGLHSDCDQAEADTGRMARTVAELGDGYDKIIAAEGLPGKVVFWNGVGAYDWTYNADCQAIFENTVHWFTVRYQHELVVFLEAPTFLEPGNSTLLNGTVSNQGLSDETGLELHILINNTLVESLQIPLLSNGTSQTASHLWTPRASGIYNVTVYAPPVPGENQTSNNVYSRFIPVRFAPKILAYVEYTDYYQEYPNTLIAISRTFGPNYKLTEFWNYPELDLLLPGKDILLIPEQDYTDRYILEIIGAAWSETLTEFLRDGGTVIVCDYNGGSGGTYGILTGAGLMSILGANYRTGSTLFLADPTDLLAKGVSPSFTAPYGTISFFTQETNVVVDDGAYPAVIHKVVDSGHVALLGFDYSLSCPDTEQLLGNAIALSASIAISATPSGGSPGTEVIIRGTKATPAGTVSVYWDDRFAGNTTVNATGGFTFLLEVPFNATVGIHEITAVDLSTTRMASTTFRVILVALDHSSGSVGTRTTVTGAGFQPESQATIKFNDMLIGYAPVNDSGNFTFTFNVPLSTPGVQTVKALDAEANRAEAAFVVKDFTPLDVEADVGSLIFRGEIAELYTQIEFQGVAVNATSFKATLYGPSGKAAYYRHPENTTLVTTGFYKMTYAVPGNASLGTYALVVEAAYNTSIAEASGTSFASFSLSSTLTGWNALLIALNGSVGVVMTELGVIEVSLSAIDAKLVAVEGTVATVNTTLGLIHTDIASIELNVTAINDSIATIQTTLGPLEGRITSVQDDIASIETDLGTVKVDISGLREAQQALSIPLYAAIILLLVTAFGTLLIAFLVRASRKD